MARALRPFTRPWRQAGATQLDVDATVDRYAEHRLFIPVVQTAPERWFEVVIVVDDAPTMAVWHDTIAEFTQVFARTGFFRAVHRWILTDIEITDHLGRTTAVGDAGAVARVPNARRLVLIISDFTSTAWHGPLLWELVKAWARATPVALVNPLPIRFWAHSGLNLPTVRATATGSPDLTSTLHFSVPLRARLTSDSWLPVPALTLTPAAIDRWARTIVRNAPDGCDAVLVPTHRAAPTMAHATHGIAAEAFLRTAAAPAARLALLCSSFEHFSLPLLRLLQTNAVPEAEPADVAELLISGLATIDDSRSENPVLTYYPAAREYLLDHVTEDDVWAAHQALTSFIAAHPDATQSMLALAHTPEGQQALPAELRPFAAATTETLRLLDIHMGRLRTNAEWQNVNDASSEPAENGIAHAAAASSITAAARAVGHLAESARQQRRLPLEVVSAWQAMRTGVQRSMPRAWDATTGELLPPAEPSITETIPFQHQLDRALQHATDGLDPLAATLVAELHAVRTTAPHLGRWCEWVEASAREVLRASGRWPGRPPEDDDESLPGALTELFRASAALSAASQGQPAEQPPAPSAPLADPMEAHAQRRMSAEQHSVPAQVHPLHADATIPTTRGAPVAYEDDHFGRSPMGRSVGGVFTHADRLRVDGLLVQHFRESGLTGSQWDHFQRELLTRGLAIVTRLVRSGAMFTRSGRHGRYLHQEAIPLDEAEELASDAVYEGFVIFCERGLLGREWSAEHGQPLNEYFVNACVLAFPNVYRRWQARMNSWRDVDLVDSFASLEQVVAEGTPEDAVVEQQAANAAFAALSEDNRRLLLLHDQGYSHAEIAELTRLTPRAVESRIRRARLTVRQDQSE